MADMSFGNIILAQSGKKGILPPMKNEDGTNSEYYLLNAGGFNIPNRHGITYPVNRYIEECMQPQSDLRRRIERGEVYGEWGHPSPVYYEEMNGVLVKRTITQVWQWINRLKEIDKNNICMHIRAIHFDTSQWRGGSRGPIYNLIEVCPYGDREKLFRDNITNPSMNTSVSIRTVITPFEYGDTIKNTEYWTGYDAVLEAGMNHSNKHMTAGCEGYDSSNPYPDEYCLTVDKDEAMQAIEHEMSILAKDPSVAGMESFDDLTRMVSALKNNMRQQDSRILVPSSSLSLF